MPFPLLVSWRRESAYYTYIYCQFLIGVPYFIFNTYVLYQLQVVGFLIGTDLDGNPCTTYCIVPWGGTRLDLNSVLLYINAFGFVLGGTLMTFLSAYSDFWARKHLLVTICIILTGVLAVPVFWLRNITVRDFQSLSGLCIAFGITTLITGPLLNVYMPYCMRNADIPGVGTTEHHNVEVERTGPGDNSRIRSYGFVMSTLGVVANYVGSVLILVLAIVLSRTLSGNAAETVGLLITTIVGFLTVVGSVVAYWGFPAIPARPSSVLKESWIRPVLELFKPFSDLVVRKNMSALLISYTVYTDCAIAVSSVTTQLFLAELRPGALEFSLYSLALSLMGLCCPLIFFWIQGWAKVRLETWLLAGYVLTLVIPLWGCVGLSSVNLGFKNRWEFYVELFLFQLSQTFVNVAFRVIFSELIPPGSEVEWFGLQVILSCGTVWINYVASGPLQNTTHQLRFPLVISLIFLMVSVVVEVCRCTVKTFEVDRKRWERVDKAASAKSTTSATVDRGTTEDVDVPNKA